MAASPSSNVTTGGRWVRSADILPLRDMAHDGDIQRARGAAGEGDEGCNTDCGNGIAMHGADGARTDLPDPECCHRAAPLALSGQV